jgi:hypothetical protein
VENENYLILDTGTDLSRMHPLSVSKNIATDEASAIRKFTFTSIVFVYFVRCSHFTTRFD